ncbi:ABC transporter ATP-binding protein [Rhodovulum sp. 12E13]|uniref:ABC transporter ATP-binding protein n=1 Tax=Rhodovulum sp. 12E13 TaxID=2203891 RepID=UPI000E13FFE2|nr:ABC transporter ATP-binding protein [Rhodovulum sp. 12E13]RDC72377.1 ABC transporter ATP-binding protein [Rhodovulum sp. 12E13]
MAEHPDKAGRIFEVDDIRVTFDTADGAVEAVRGVSMHVGRGETVAVVGESGSGKSQIMMAAMGLLANNGRAAGAVRYRGRDILNVSVAELNRLRGRKITMIFQEPMTSLDPLYTIEDQLSEPLRVHGGMSRQAARARILELLNLVQIPNAAERMRSYPHELSGGQRQRVMIAMALANDPELLIADEPTTALDVTIQAEILQLLAELQSRIGMSILFITHDLGIVEAFADRTYVMNKGRVEEEGPTARLFSAPRTDYTKMLLAAEPEGTKAPLPANAPALMEAREMRVTFGRGPGLFRRDTRLEAVRGIDVTLRQGQTLGIVGESGSGKSTLGRALLQMIPSEGQVVWLGDRIEGLGTEGMRPYRKGLQMVFQDPYGSLSPRLTCGEIVAEGLLVHEPGLDSKARTERVSEAMADVGLDPAMRNRFPHEFSGGQRQRIAIARALILRPKLIVLDEPTSALDRSVQKQVIELLRRLQRENDLTYIFISHDLAVVRALSDYVMVMKDGAVVEEGPTGELFDRPETDYTRALMRAAFDLRGLLADKAA